MLTFGKMLRTLVFLVLICSVYSTDESIVEQDQTSEYNTLQVRMDHLQKNQEKMSLDLNHVKDVTQQLLDKQNTMMERILEILTLSNNTNQIVDKTFGNHTFDPCQSASSSGVFPINCEACPPGSKVYCEVESFDGGWLVVQQRLDGSVNFTRPWTDYRDGFGTPGKYSEFWLGLELLHRITTSGEYELSIELAQSGERYENVRYTEFKVAGEKEKYRMAKLGEFSGTIKDMLRSHAGRRFSTYDQDNDDWSEVNCAVSYFSGGGWWYSACAQSVLNGPYAKNRMGNGIRWAGWTDAATYSRMMIRRK